MHIHSKESLRSIINLSEHLYDSLNDMDVEDFQKNISDYTEKIEQYFLERKTQKFTQEISQELSQEEQEELKQLISAHKKMTDLLSQEKENISKRLKKIHAGKEMKNTYPLLI